MLYSTLLTEVKKKMRIAAIFFRDPSSSGETCLCRGLPPVESQIEREKPQASYYR
jgi:hypothetical protein